MIIASIVMIVIYSILFFRSRLNAKTRMRTGYQHWMWSVTGNLHFDFFFRIQEFILFGRMSLSYKNGYHLSLEGSRKFPLYLICIQFTDLKISGFSFESFDENVPLFDFPPCFVLMRCFVSSSGFLFFGFELGTCHPRGSPVR